ncbi:S-adenosyl-L-methionine-dependent tRNA 4-demethylwyosine synthase [uncultured archaeon]|nr:S-adenosyl-L-methionine-dependent tRNA 4-demethylwyosine synthase [uncultured archaeon]
MNKRELLADFAHKKYGFFEDASVQVCEWNKKSLRGQGNCYKQDFYGADTISCHQIAPTTFWCNNSCVFCWRPKEYMKGTPKKTADPKKMIEALIEERRNLISGFGGHDKVSKETYSRARESRHWAISLSGEPTLYKKLPELISLLKKRKGTETVFLVSNGQNPKMLQKLWSESKKAKSENENSLPTQLYISMVAPEEKLWKGITLNREKGGWKKYLRSLALLKLLPCRTVIRLTVIKGMNDSKETQEKFAELLEAVQTDFIEVKSYMWLGLSRKRLTAENNPSHEYTKDFALSLLKRMPSYKFESEKANSRIALLKNKGSKYKTKIIERN